MKRFTLLSITALMLCFTARVTAQQNSSGSKQPATFRIEGTKSSGKEPLYVVNGKVVDDTLNELDPNQIESIKILKDASSIAQYGKEGINGIILITTKNRPEEAAYLNKVIIRGNDSYGKNPVLVLDGKLIAQTSLNELDPNKIQSISILKDVSAIALYGKEAENGVVVIVTKKDESSKTKN